jgi:hypothetical protein
MGSATSSTVVKGGMNVTGTIKCENIQPVTALNNITLGTGSSVTIDDTLKVATITGYGVDTIIRIGTNLTTGSIQMGNSQTTGTITLGKSGSNTTIYGTATIVQGITVQAGDTPNHIKLQRNGDFTIGIDANSPSKLILGAATNAVSIPGRLLVATIGTTYVSGYEPGIECSKNLSLNSVGSSKLVWPYNWSMWAENGTSMYFYYGSNPESASSSIAVARIGGNGGFVTISDIRKKQDIGDLTYGLDTIQQLRPVSFSYKTNPNDTELGFIAQEVETIIPEIVDLDGKDGDEAVKGIKYIGFVPILVKAVQEMKLDYETKIQELKSDYDAKLSTLEARLLALEQKNV